MREREGTWMIIAILMCITLGLLIAGVFELEISKAAKHFYSALASICFALLFFLTLAFD